MKWYNEVASVLMWAHGAAAFGLVASGLACAGWAIVRRSLGEPSPLVEDHFAAIGTLWGLLIGPATAICLAAVVFGWRVSKMGPMCGLGLLTSLALAGGCSGLAVPESNSEYWKYRAAAEIALVASSPDTMPDVPPDGSLGKCSNCQGTGKVGDGRTFRTCVPCGGDGRIDKDDIADAPVDIPPVGEITLHITDVDRVGWPAKWWAELKDDFVDHGYKVGFQKHSVSQQRGAYFDIVITGSPKVWQFFGPIELSSVRHLEISYRGEK